MKKPKDPNRVTIYMSISAKTYDQIRAIANAEHRPITAHVVMVLEAYLAKRAQKGKAK